MSFGGILQLLAQGVADTLCCTAQDLALYSHASSTMQDFVPVSGQSPGLPAPAPGGPQGRSPAEAGQRTGWTPAPARCVRGRRALLRRQRPPRLPWHRRPGARVACGKALAVGDLQLLSCATQEELGEFYTLLYEALQPSSRPPPCVGCSIVAVSSAMRTAPPPAAPRPTAGRGRQSGSQRRPGRSVSVASRWRTGMWCGPSRTAAARSTRARSRPGEFSASTST